MPTVYLGPEYTDDEIEEFLQHGVQEIIGADKKVVYTKLPNREALVKTTAELINGTNVIGLMQGRMEFGPRALGNRSIIADARNKENWQKVNLKIKFRESFRPFAPTVLADQAADWFDLACPSPTCRA
jgi:carbamoyltransferase